MSKDKRKFQNNQKNNHNNNKHKKNKDKKRKRDDEEDVDDEVKERREELAMYRWKITDKDPDLDEQKPKKKKKSEHSTPRPLNFQLPIPDWSQFPLKFKKELWTGPAGEENPSEELKLLRKSIGVNAKGNLGMCPPPVVEISNPNLPALFSQYFTAHSLTKPTSVQQQCWPCLLNGSNVLGIAPTGSGKTLAYLLPGYSHITAQTNKSGSSFSTLIPNILVLVPTRELAIQVNSVCKSFKSILPKLKSGVLYGGQEKEGQLEELLNHAASTKVIIATPGRLIDLLGNNSQAINLKSVSYVVIDEADRMLSLGFTEQVTTILNQIRPEKQIVLFSATFPGNLRQLSEVWAPNATVVRCNAIDLSTISSIPMEQGTNEEEPVAVAEDVEGNELAEDSRKKKNDKQDQTDVKKSDENEEDTTNPAENTKNKHDSSFQSSITVSPTVNQFIHICAPHKRPRLLIKYIEKIRKEEKETKQRQASPMIIFCNKIKTLNFVIDFLTRQEIMVVPLHGQLPQQKREENLLNLKSGKVNIIVCTDVAARGIHIKRLKHVVNYDFPSNIEQYCHRIGRVGRQGEYGEAYSLMTRNFAPLANDLIALLKRCGKEPEPNLEKLAVDYSLGKILDDLDETLGNNEDDQNNKEEDQEEDEEENS